MTTYKENGLTWTIMSSERAADYIAMLGLIPSFLHALDNRPAREQFQENYAHGGGWSPMEGWTLVPLPALGDAKQFAIQYPGDPAYKPIASTWIGLVNEGEHIYVYPNAWVAIVQPDNTFEVARID